MTASTAPLRSWSLAIGMAPRPSSASTIPGPPQTRTRSPRCTSSAAAIEDEITAPHRRDLVSRAVSLRRHRPRRYELLVTNTTMSSALLQLGHRLRRTGNGVVAEPHHAVEIEHPVQGTRACHASIDACPASLRSRASGTRHDDLGSVTAPPYDVIDADERQRLLERHPHNVVRVDLPVGGDDPYGDAAATFRQWQADRRPRDRRSVPVPVPHDLRRRSRPPPPDPRRHRRARTRAARNRRRAPPRAHDPEGEERPARPACVPPRRTSRPCGACPSPAACRRCSIPPALGTIGSWQDDDGVSHELWQLD